MLELYAALAVTLAVSLGLRVWFRWFHHDGAPDAAFERWCAETPLVLAVRCAPGASRDVLDTLRHLTASGEALGNRQGRYPWQHYLVELEERRLSEDVVGVVIAACRLQRGTRSHPDVSRVVEGLAPIAAQVEELWLHGQLHSAGRHLRFDRNRTGWTGRITPEGKLEAGPIIGLPAWLPQRTRALRAAGSG